MPAEDQEAGHQGGGDGEDDPLPGGVAWPVAMFKMFKMFKVFKMFKMFLKDVYYAIWTPRVGSINMAVRRHVLAV